MTEHPEKAARSALARRIAPHPVRIAQPPRRSAPHPVAHCATAAPHCSSPGCALRNRRAALFLTLLRTAQLPLRVAPHPVAHCTTAAPHCSSPCCALRNRRSALLCQRPPNFPPGWPAKNPPLELVISRVRRSVGCFVSASALFSQWQGLWELWETPTGSCRRFPSRVGRRGLIAAFHRTAASIARSPASQSSVEIESGVTLGRPNTPALRFSLSR
jgi:hypothetical protein